MHIRIPILAHRRIIFTNIPMWITGRDDRVTYYSSTIGEDKQCGVLLPPGYDTSNKYPVVYLLHGFGGDHFDWNRGDCYVQDIYGNMLANNTAVPAIVVMPDMYTAPADTKETADGEQKRAAYDKLVYDLENDLMPYIESHYAVKTGREKHSDYRYFAGRNRSACNRIFIAG